MADDSRTKKPSIPNWQLGPAADAAESSQQSSSHTADETRSLDHSALVEQAKSFLRVPSMQSAPREEKVAFLKEKGLSGEAIQDLLDGLRTAHDSSQTSAPAESAPSSSSPSPSSQAEGLSESDNTVPPIITYPEFLLRPAKPPPLVTLDRLAYAAYALASISAVAYGASKFLIQPMLQSLTAARHELSGTALQNLDALNKKLEEKVSHIPPVQRQGSGHHIGRLSLEDGAISDVETVESDPTELFHRDIATQTSPPRTRSSSISNTTSATPASSLSPNGDKDATTAQSASLKTLSQSLSPFLDKDEKSQPDGITTSTNAIPSLTVSSPGHSFTANTNTKTKINTLLSTLADCHTHLTKLNSNFHTQTHTSTSSSSYSTTPQREKEEDEATKFKQEIRAVKGAMLGVRSFPRGTPMVGVGLASGR